MLNSFLFKDTQILTILQNFWKVNWIFALYLLHIDVIILHFKLFIFILLSSIFNFVLSVKWLTSLDHFLFYEWHVFIVKTLFKILSIKEDIRIFKL